MLGFFGHYKIWIKNQYFFSYLGSNSLLIGKLIGQGSSRAELVGEARTNGVNSDQIQEVKVSFLIDFWTNDLILKIKGDLNYGQIICKMTFLTGKRNCWER